MIKILPYVFLLLALTGCGYTATHPCCRIRSGFERTNSINLRPVFIKNPVAVYQTDKYLIFLDRGTTSQFLLNHKLIGNDVILGLYESDTLALSNVIDQKNILKKYISSEIDRGQVTILYKKDKTRLTEIERRVYNIKRPRFGAGGKDYRDAKSGELILQVPYWSWMA